MDKKFKGLILSHKAHKICYHPQASGVNCSGGIINAHTVQKSGGLKKIAKDSHVFYFKPTFDALVRNNGRFNEVLEGINQASTFTGFCKKHDNELFSPVENFLFNDTQEHVGLLSFRAICRELHTKENQRTLHLKAINYIKENDYEKYSSIEQWHLDHLHGIDLGLKEISSIKRAFDDLITSKDYSGINFLSIRVKDITEIMLSGAVVPESTFGGIHLSSLGQAVPISDYIIVNIFASDKEGNILLSWLGNSDKNETFCASLLSLIKNDFSNAIIRFAFEYFENTFISPVFWNSLTLGQKKKIQQRVMHMSGERKSNCLINDGAKYVKDWDIISINSNVSKIRV